MKSRTIMLIATFLGLVGFLVVRAGGSESDWEFVVDAEARAGGTVVATQQIRTSACEDDGEGACVIAWSWEGEELPDSAVEWIKAYFLVQDATIPVAFVPYWCDVDLELCKATLECNGETIVTEPSAECLAELSDVCGLEPDERGFWYAGALPKDEGDHYAFYEPLGEWYDVCPLPPDTATPAPIPLTYTPQPTYTPDPTPTCRPTWTPVPTDTPYPTQTPLPTSTPLPTQPPF